MIRLKRWGALGEKYIYIRPEKVIAIWASDRMTCVELSGRENELMIDGDLKDVAAKLGLTLID